MSNTIIQEEVTVILLRKINKISEQLELFLKENGLNPTDNKLASLIDDLNKLQIISPNKSYLGVHLKNGFISDVITVDKVVENQPLPEDIYSGYYRVDNKGNIILDEEQKIRLWED